jgi:4-diphosphocytidyl-2-C-methyl-D-erythritol kinase
MGTGSHPEAKTRVGTEAASVRVAAPAKVNFFLRILAKEESGYHQLETLYSAVDFCDEIVLQRTERGISVEVFGPSVGPEEENLAYRAAHALLEAAGSTTGVHIRLTKNIPVGAGLGGGSSDAGATLRALNTLLGDPVSASGLLQIAGPLGADVPFFASGGGAALAWGRGERLLPLPDAPRLSVLLAFPSLHIATAEAYEYVRIPEHIVPETLALGALGHPETLAALAKNDFEASVFERHPVLGKLREAVHEAGALTARLSGSGAALFGLFNDRGAAEGARASLSASWADVRFVVTETLEAQPEPVPDLGSL